jgi:hypothetical protein
VNHAFAICQVRHFAVGFASGFTRARIRALRPNERGFRMALRNKSWMALGLFGTLSLACNSSEKDSSAGASPAPSTVAPAPDHADHAAQPAAQPPTAPAGAKVFFVEPKDGAEVTGPVADGKVTVHVKMGAEGITVQPAGEQVQGTGHHHIIVDGAGLSAGAVIPKDDTHQHYGKGQTEADLPLTPGEHTLTMQFADGAHLSYGPALSSTIKVKVVPGAPAAAK